MDSNRRKDSRLGVFLWHCIQQSGMTYENVAEALGVSTRVVTIAVVKESPVKLHCFAFCVLSMLKQRISLFEGVSFF